MKAIKFKTFASLATAINGSTNTDKWLQFLKDKGHTETTFSYLPENLQTDLKFSFARKTKTA